jgi:hypothetical protein
MGVTAQWWGYNKEQGWVIMDRDLPCNVPGMRGELLFFRCRDAEIFYLKRELWRSPAWEYAPNYVRSLSGDAATDAEAELAELTHRWPQFQQNLHNQYNAIVEREEAERREAEKRQKREAAEQKKKKATVTRLKAAGAEEEAETE